jgi:hypothetical protein
MGLSMVCVTNVMLLVRTNREPRTGRLLKMFEM